MSFKTILKNKTNDSIDRIKKTAINEFISCLKTHMINIAEYGKNKGNIDLTGIGCSEYDDLEEILLYYSEITHAEGFYQWLLKNSKKTGEFDDIEMNISEDDYANLYFEWDLYD